MVIRGLIRFVSKRERLTEIHRALTVKYGSYRTGKRMFALTAFCLVNLVFVVGSTPLCDQLRRRVLKLRGTVKGTTKYLVYKIECD